MSGRFPEPATTQKLPKTPDMEATSGSVFMIPNYSGYLVGV